MDLVEKLNGAVREALQTDQAKKIIADGHATAVLNSPSEAVAWIKAESDRWGAIIRRNGIRIE
jgi:tripartite-type tricarboxylate transporter receptor subunit TctC